MTMPKKVGALVAIGVLSFATGCTRPVRRAAYSFQQLSDWRDWVVDSLLGRYGVTFDDADEGSNRVAAVTTAQALVTQELKDLGIPIAAVHFLSKSPATLQRLSTGRAIALRC